MLVMLAILIRHLLKLSGLRPIINLFSPRFLLGAIRNIYFSISY